MSQINSYIAHQIRAASWDSLSSEAKNKLKLCILADISVAVSGIPYVKLPEPKITKSETGFFVFPNHKTASQADAAYYNAAVMHARNQDDFHPEGRLHVGTIALPVAMAMSEHTDVDGKTFLDALVAGYVAGIGLSRKFATAATKRGFRSTGVFGPFVAVSCAASMAKLDEAKTANALGIATSFAAGTGQCWVDGSDEWQLHAANAARAGVMAIEMVKHGTRGASNAFDGKAGFHAAVTGEAVVLEDFMGEFDASRAIMESVVKRYSVSGINQSVVLVAERIVKANAINPKDIDRIVIRLHATDLNYPGTQNSSGFQSFADAMMSALFCTANVFANGAYAFKDMFLMKEPLRDSIIQRTTVQADPEIPEFGVRIDVHLSNGSVMTERTLDPAVDLEIGWDEVDAWSAPMWEESKRAEQFAKCKEIVFALENRRVSDLFHLLKS